MTMRIPEETNPGLDDWLAEFDEWVTPELGRIQDSEKFRAELSSIIGVLDILSNETEAFSATASINIRQIADVLIEKALAGGNRSLLSELVSLLLIVTGKSDNNLKCQFPLYLRKEKGMHQLPKKVIYRGSFAMDWADVPRVLKCNDICNRVMGLLEIGSEDTRAYKEGSQLFEMLVEFILDDESSLRQLWALGWSYTSIGRLGDKSASALLTPLVMFKVRGSVSASGGHEPEEILKKHLASWGLVENLDFNSHDIDPIAIADGGAVSRSKARSYDFVLPYRTCGWTPKIFVQSQFYAGDSGSVSHKNVDQSTTSRAAVSECYDFPRFVEFVDGAGYYSSLNGDLKRLLEMQNTTDFVQIASIPIRLRRQMQLIGFLMPIELGLSILSGNTRIKELRSSLNKEGYSNEEFSRCIEDCLKRGLVEKIRGKFVLLEPLASEARRYFVIDAVIAASNHLGDSQPGKVRIPGFGPQYGCTLSDLGARLDMEKSVLSLTESFNLLDDLSKEGFIKLS